MTDRPSMKSLGEVLAFLKPANDQPVVPKPKRPPEGYQPPALPPDLRQQVDQIAGRCRYGDFVMQPSEPTQHPDAVRYAAEMRWALEPAPAGLIRKWLTMLAGGIGFPGDDPDRLNTSIEFHTMCNGDLPARCWTKETLILAGNRLTFWPKPAEINALLEPIAEEIRRDLDALDTVAKAPNVYRPGPARPSTTPYDPGPLPEWVTRNAPHPSMPKAEDEAEIVEAGLEPRAQDAERTVEEQQAAFGQTPESAAAGLAAARESFAARLAPREPKP